MAKDSNGHPVGNTDNQKRGRGVTDGTAVGQRIPDEVKEKIEPPKKEK